MHYFMSSTFSVAIDVLYNLALQEFNTLFTQLWVDQPLYSLIKMSRGTFIFQEPLQSYLWSLWAFEFPYST